MNEKSRNMEEAIDKTEENQTDMKQPEELSSSGQRGALLLLRAGTVLLAAVSFWATAQGMADYVFSEQWQAYAASLAIQGILLGLNFYLPTFWRYLKGHGGNKTILVMLTAVVLFCSSWFSFIFIVGQTYGESWGIDSRILVQKTYREQLYAADDYTEEYQDLLREVVGNQVLDLYDRAGDLGSDEAKIGSSLDWNQERMNYTVEDFAARSTMSAVIDAVEVALQENAPPNVREQALGIVMEMRGNLESEVTSLNSQLGAANDAVEQAARNLQEAQARLNAARTAEERASLSNIEVNARTYLESSQVALQNLQNRLEDYREALSRVQFYEVNLGLTESGSVNLISASLRKIQQELFQDEPDLDSLYSQAVNVFQQLQSGINIEKEGNGVSGGNSNEAYQELLVAMDMFMANLRDYQAIRIALSQLDDMVSAMSTDTDILMNSEDWKDEWLYRLDSLKAVISGLPAYSDEENVILERYNRASASEDLDEMIRKYIADHNAVEQGIIYLFSPYCGLAWFSLILAFFLDIAAFITGMIIDTIDMQKKKRGTKGRQRQLQKKDNIWYVPQEVPLNRYVYLNGDYSREAGKNFYRTIENGNELKWELSSGDYHKGIYIVCDKELKRLIGKELKFLAEGPQDGVYLSKCNVKYEEGILTLISYEDEKVLCSVQVETDTPLYRMGTEGCKIMPVQSLKNMKSEEIVIALNKKGSRVIAVYII